MSTDPPSGEGEISEVDSVQELLEDLLENLSDDPDCLQIDKHVTAHSAIFDVHVSNDREVGKVLGRHGAHAKALRTLFTAIYGRLGRRFHLNIVDPRR
jgi:predicted RNA-binding protein YlqC (UPF0109 family)